MVSFQWLAHSARRRGGRLKLKQNAAVGRSSTVKSGRRTARRWGDADRAVRSLPVGAALELIQRGQDPAGVRIAQPEDSAVSGCPTVAGGAVKVATLAPGQPDEGSAAVAA